MYKLEEYLTRDKIVSENEADQMPGYKNFQVLVVQKL